MARNGFLKLKNTINNPKIKIVAYNLILLMTLLLLFEPTTKSDDYDMSNLAYGGIDGEYSPFILYSNVLYGYLLKVLMTLFPNVAWFYVVEYILMFCAFSTITYILYKRNSNKVAIFLSSIVIMIAGYEFYIRVTFSKTSGLIIAAGYLCLLYLIDNENRKIRYWIWAIVLIVFGILIRESMFKGITLVFVSSFIIFLYKRWGKGFADLWKPCVQFIVMVILLFIILKGVGIFSNNIISTDDVWRNYLSDNFRRANLVDYGVPNFDAYEEEYSAIDVSRADYNMWFIIANRGDRSLLTNEKYKEIAAIRENTFVDETPKSQRIIDALYALMKYQKENTMFYVLLLVALCLLLIDKKNFGFVFFCTNGLCIIAYLYLSYTGRTQHHVDASLYFAGALITLYFIQSREIQIKVDKLVLLTSLLVIIFINSFYSQLLSSSYYGTDFGMISSQKEQYKNRYDILSLFSEDKEHFYVIGARETNTSYACFTVFEPIKKNFYNNIYRPNMNHIPVFENVLEEHQIDNIWDEITNSKKIYYIASKNWLSDVTVVEEYIKDNYNENVRKVLVKQIEDMYVYRFVDDTFSVDVSTVKNNADEVEYSIDKVYDEAGNINISGYAYVEGEDSYAQNVYVQAVNKKNGEYKIYTCFQTENSGLKNNDKYNGKYSSFSIVINTESLKAAKLKEKDVELNLLLEVNDNLYQIPIK